MSQEPMSSQDNQKRGQKRPRESELAKPEIRPQQEISFDAFVQGVQQGSLKVESLESLLVQTKGFSKQDIRQALLGFKIPIIDFMGKEKLHTKYLIDFAAEHGMISVVKWLLQHGLSTNPPRVYQNYQYTKELAYKPVAVAGEHRQMALLRYLIEQAGFDIDTLDVEERSAAFYAASNGDLEMFEYLMEQGAELLVQDSGGMIPLIAALDFGHTNIVEAWFRAAAGNLRPKSQDCYTTLYEFIIWGHFELATRIIQHRTEIHEAFYCCINHAIKASIENESFQLDNITNDFFPVLFHFLCYGNILQAVFNPLLGEALTTQLKNVFFPPQLNITSNSLLAKELTIPLHRWALVDERYETLISIQQDYLANVIASDEDEDETNYVLRQEDHIKIISQFIGNYKASQPIPRLRALAQRAASSHEHVLLAEENDLPIALYDLDRMLPKPSYMSYSFNRIAVLKSLHKKLKTTSLLPTNSTWCFFSNIAVNSKDCELREITARYLLCAWMKWYALQCNDQLVTDDLVTKNKDELKTFISDRFASAKQELSAMRKKVCVEYYVAEKRVYDVINHSCVEKAYTFFSHRFNNDILSRYYDAKEAQLITTHNEKLVKLEQTIATQEDQIATGLAPSQK